MKKEELPTTNIKKKTEKNSKKVSEDKKSEEDPDIEETKGDKKPSKNAISKELQLNDPKSDFEIELSEIKLEYSDSFEIIHQDFDKNMVLLRIQFT